MDDDWGANNSYWGESGNDDNNSSFVPGGSGVGAAPAGPAGPAGPMGSVGQGGGVPGQMGGFNQMGTPGMQQGYAPQMAGQGYSPQDAQGGPTAYGDDPNAVPEGQNAQSDSGNANKGKNDRKNIIMLIVGIVIVVLLGIGVWSFYSALNNSTASVEQPTQTQTQTQGGATGSESAEGQGSNGGSATEDQSSTSRGDSQGITKDDQSADGGVDMQDDANGKSLDDQDSGSGTQWDTPTTPQASGIDLTEVNSLPNVANQGTSGGIVTAKHVYATGDTSYVYSLEITMASGDGQTVSEFFVSKDAFDSVNTGIMVSVNYVQYADGRVGITSVDTNAN